MNMEDILVLASLIIMFLGGIWLPIVYAKKQKGLFYKSELSKINTTNCYECKCQYCGLKKYLEKENKDER